MCPAVRLLADPPFIYLIRDTRSGCMVFLGQFEDSSTVR